MKRAIQMVFLLVWLFSHSVLRADGLPQYRSRNWQTDDGLPHNTVSAVLCSREGYIWAGTAHGAARFDGARFTLFNPQNTPAFTEPSVRCLYQAKDGKVWFGGESGSLVCLRNGKFVRSDLAAGRQVRSMFEARDGTFWIGTMNGLGRFKDGRTDWFTTADGLAGNSVLAICEDHEGNIWIGSTRGLTMYRDTFVRSYDDRTGLTSNSIRALLCDREGTLWIGTSGGGLVRLRNGEFRAFNKGHGLPDVFVSALFEDGAGQLWVGTMGGLGRRVGRVFLTELDAEGASYETVFSLAADHENGLWFGTKEGLNQVIPKPFRSYTKQEGLPHNNVMSVMEDRDKTIWVTTWGGGLCGLRNGRMTSYNRSSSPLFDMLLAVRQASDGGLWLGTDFNAGLFYFKHEQFTQYGPQHGLIDSAVRVVHEDRRGNVWLGTSGALYLFKDRQFRRFTKADGLIGNIVRVLCEDHQGNLWIGTTEGLASLAASEVQNATVARSAGPDVNGSGSVARDEGSSAGTGTNLQPADLHFDSYTTNNGLPFNSIIALFEDAQRHLWIGTDGGGLARLKSDEHQGSKRFFNTYTTRHGLFSDNIAEILEDDRGFLWMSCFSGVFRVKKSDLDRLDRREIRNLNCTSYGKVDGLSSIQCNNVSKPAGWKSSDGQLWFPTTRGVVSVDPRSLNESFPPPPVTIEEVIVDKGKVEESAWKEDGQLRGANGQSRASLKAPPGRGELEFHYAALSFRAPEKNRFKYRLVGVDPEWVDAGNRRTAYYNNVRPGNYTFRVIASAGDGVWNEQGASVSFVLLPHVWQTWWFRSAVAALSLCLVAALARFVTKRRMLLNLQRLEQQHALQKERTRIAQDMHDDLGARLTQILMLNDFALKAKGGEAETMSHVAKAVQVTQDLVRNLDAIVWAVNPQNDSLESLVLYLYEYFEMFLCPSSIRYRLDVPKTLPSRAVTSEMRHNIFLVVKEALNNIVKHAGASEVWLRLRVESTGAEALQQRRLTSGSESKPERVEGPDPDALALIVAIEDDGCGLPDTAESAFSSGLINMKKRIEKVGGRFEIRSGKGKGTLIELSVPLRNTV